MDWQRRQMVAFTASACGHPKRLRSADSNQHMPTGQTVRTLAVPMRSNQESTNISDRLRHTPDVRDICHDVGDDQTT